MGRNGNGASFFYVGTQPVGLLPKPEPTSFYKWVFFFFFLKPQTRPVGPRGPYPAMPQFGPKTMA